MSKRMEGIANAVAVAMGFENWQSDIITKEIGLAKNRGGARKQLNLMVKDVGLASERVKENWAGPGDTAKGIAAELGFESWRDDIITREVATSSDQDDAIKRLFNLATDLQDVLALLRQWRTPRGLPKSAYQNELQAV